jgi:TetR/AcrR family transcriptional regulator, cholesterol catabolism regulator
MPKIKVKDRETAGPTARKLIDVAIDLFSRKGFKGTSIRDIAAEMNMTTSNIYHYFGTKGGVLAAIERETLEPLMSEFRQIKDLDLPPLDRLSLLVRTHLTYMDSHRKESKIFSLLSEETAPGTKDLNRRFQEETFEIYRAEIERVWAISGKTANSTIATFSTLGVVIWFLQWYQPGGKSSLEEVITTIINYVLYGIIGEEKP